VYSLPVFLKVPMVAMSDLLLVSRARAHRGLDGDRRAGGDRRRTQLAGPKRSGGRRRTAFLYREECGVAAGEES
jgi:hypothetical protein